MKIIDKKEQIETNIIEVILTPEEWIEFENNMNEGSWDVLDWLYEKTNRKDFNTSSITFFWHDDYECRILTDDFGDYSLLRIAEESKVFNKSNKINGRISMEKDYIKVNSRELAEMIFTAPFGSLFSFGVPRDSDYSVDTLIKDAVECLDGCYTEVGKLNNRLFVIDAYGGGYTQVESLEDIHGNGFTDSDKECIESTIESYFDYWIENKIVYARIEKEVF